MYEKFTQRLNNGRWEETFFFTELYNLQSWQAIWTGTQIKEYEMGKACTTVGEDEWVIHTVVGREMVGCDIKMALEN